MQLLTKMFEMAGRLSLLESLARSDGFRAERLGDVNHEKPGVVVARQVLGDLKA